MLRYSRRFDANRGIGRLAKLVNEKNAGEARQLLEHPPEQLFSLKLRGEQDSKLTRLIIDGHPEADGKPPGYRYYLEQLQQLRPATGTVWNSDGWVQWASNVLKAFDEFRLLCALRRGPWGVEGLNLRVAGELKHRKLIDTDHGWYEGRPVLRG
ncbi:RecBCD enzyme subunit RecD [compost metagenome]